MRNFFVNHELSFEHMSGLNNFKSRGNVSGKNKDYGRRHLLPTKNHPEYCSQVKTSGYTQKQLELQVISKYEKGLHFGNSSFTSNPISQPHLRATNRPVGAKTFQELSQHNQMTSPPMRKPYQDQRRNRNINLLPSVERTQPNGAEYVPTLRGQSVKRDI